MRFASCAQGDRRFAGVVDGDAVLPIEGLTELGADADLLADPPLTGERIPLEAVRLRPVVPNPSKALCVGLNYYAHIEECRQATPSYPVWFTKFSASLAGPYDVLPKPPESSRMDYEGELAVVVGRHGRRVRREDAMDHVAGFAVANDVTMRDFQERTHQWLQGKAWERSSPVGPHLVTPDDVGDPGDLRIHVTVNGQTRQDATTALMIFDVPTLVACASEFVTLAPGDLILTGTPSGVGDRRDPPVYLSPGDRVRVEVERVGVIENAVGAG